MEDRILIQCRNDAQTKALYDWLRSKGINEFISSRENKKLKGSMAECISSEEEPGATSDPSAYFLEVE